MPSMTQSPSYSGFDNRVNSGGSTATGAAPAGHLAGLSAAVFAVMTFVFLAGATERATAQSRTDFRRAKDPVIVSLRLPSPKNLLLATPTQRAELVQERGALLLEAIEQNPRRLVSLDPGRGRLRFVTLPRREQATALELKGDQAPILYELAMASLLDELLDAAILNRPDSALSVLGLPLEPQHALLGSIQDSNDRYKRVIDRLAGFVSYRTFILFGSKEIERKSVQRGLPEAFELRQGRPIIFRTNAHWTVLFGDTAKFDEFGTETKWIAYAAKPHVRASGGIGRIADDRSETAHRNQSIIPTDRRSHLKLARTESITTTYQPETAVNRHVWWHKKNAGSEVLELMAATSDSPWPVRQMQFLNESGMVEYDIEAQRWNVLEDELRQKLEHRRGEIEAIGWLMQDWEHFTVEQDWDARIAQMRVIDAIIEESLPDVIHGWYRVPDHHNNGRNILVDVLTGTDAVFLQVQTTAGDALGEYFDDVKLYAPDHQIVAYIDARSRDGSLLTDNEIVAKLDAVSALAPLSQIVVRSANGASWGEVAHALNVVRNYLVAEGNGEYSAPPDQGDRLRSARTKSPVEADQGTRPEIVVGD